MEREAILVPVTKSIQSKKDEFIRVAQAEIIIEITDDDVVTLNHFNKVWTFNYFIFDFLHHRRAPRPEDIAEARSIESEITAGNPWLESLKGTAAVFLFGAVLVTVGSRLLVDSATSLAEAMGVPSIIIGLTVVAIGTSLPELVTAISSARQNVSDLAVGNILGANVANLTLIVGGAASFNVVTMDRVTQLLNFPALLLGMCIVLWMLCSARRISRREGGILIGYYTVYVALVLGSSFF